MNKKLTLNLLKEKVRKYKIYIVIRNVVWDCKRQLSIDRTVHMADLFYHGKENMTAGEYIVASRICDIEAYRKGNTDFLWQEYFAMTMSKDVSEEKRKRLKIKFLSLLESLDEYGLNPNMDRIQVVLGKNKEYFIPNNGTHRMAWSYLSSRLFVPVTIQKKNIWFSEKGRNYWKGKGISEDKLTILEQKYVDMVDSLPRQLLFILNSKHENYQKILQIVEKNGTIEIIENKEYVDDAINENIPPCNVRKIMKTIDTFRSNAVLIKFKPYAQHLYLKRKRGKIYSTVIDGIIKEIRESNIKTRDYGIMINSVTETLMIQPWIEIYLAEKQGAFK